MRVRAVWLCAFVVLLPCASLAQGVAGNPPATPTAGRWTWRVDGNVFAGLNYQYRKFWDFWVVESQNWMMVTADRTAGARRLSLTGMLSFEPLTLQRLGSPQAFQTGETLDGAPLIDYQHPHDFVMNLGGRYGWTARGWSAYAGAYIVGEPTIGPAPFMHRPSAAMNPQVPLGHHYFDSTHITPGVLKGGVTRGALGLEGSWFRGREPDEHRWDLDLATPDSWAVRASWSRNGWSTQISGGHFRQPEAIEPFDSAKINASVSYTSAAADKPLAIMIAWGQHREFYGLKAAYLAEAAWSASPTITVYSRAELVTKNILTAGGRHPIGFTHPHVDSRLGALTLGLVREIARGRLGRIGLGGDVTGYRVPPNLADNYGQPWSFHLFLTLSPGRDAGRHVH